MSEFLTGLRIKSRGFRAGMIRELMMRYGRGTMDFLWVALEPMRENGAPVHWKKTAFQAAEARRWRTNVTLIVRQARACCRAASPAGTLAPPDLFSRRPIRAVGPSAALRREAA